MVMNKDFAKSHDALELIEIPAVALTQLFYDVQILAKMHQELIRMYEKESMLKKQHKAYLYVRDQADEMCRFDKQLVDVILDHYVNPKKYMDQAICFHNTLRDKSREHNADRTKEKMDVFVLPHGMVMMSTGTLGVMQDDMLALTVAVDQLADAFRSMEKGGGYNRNEMNKLIGSASDLARDVFNRWDDAELGELG